MDKDVPAWVLLPKGLNLLHVACESPKVSRDVLEFLVNSSIPVNHETEKGGYLTTPLDYLCYTYKHARGEDHLLFAVEYLLSIGAQTGGKREVYGWSCDWKSEWEIGEEKKELFPEIYAILAFYGTNRTKLTTTKDFSFAFKEQVLRYLGNLRDSIRDNKVFMRDIHSANFDTQKEPVWDPEEIDFSKVPIQYFLDALCLFINGSYAESHPYFAKVDKKPGFPIEQKEEFFSHVKEYLQDISTRLHWSSTEREVLYEEAEREFKKIKTDKTE